MNEIKVGDLVKIGAHKKNCRCEYCKTYGFPKSPAANYKNDIAIVVKIEINGFDPDNHKYFLYGEFNSLEPHFKPYGTQYISKII